MKDEYRSRITALKTERATLVSEMRAELDAADAAKRGLTAEASAAYDEREARVSAIDKDVKRFEGIAGISNPEVSRDLETDSETRPGVTLDAAMRSPEGRAAYVNGPEYREAFTAHLLGSPLTGEQRAALNVGTGSQGAYLVPTDLQRTILAAAREFGLVRSLANVIQTAQGNPLDWSKNASHVSAAWVAEATGAAESEPTFSKLTLNSFKMAVKSIYSSEFLRDAIIDPYQYLGQEFGEAQALLENTAFVNGVGTTQPSGILDATVGIGAGRYTTAGSATAIAADELLTIQHAIRRPYRADASWLMNDQTILAIRKLKDTTGQYIWQPGLIAGDPDTLLGRPCYTDPDMATIATTAKTVLFGNFKRGYVIRDVANQTIKQLNELLALSDQVAVVLFQSMDAKVVDDLAFACLKQA